MSEHKENAGAYSGLIAAQVFFGSLPVIGKIVLATIPALALVGFRVGVTALVLIIVQVIRGRTKLKEKGDYFRPAVLSLFGVIFNQLLFVYGLSLTKASNTSLLAVTIPIFALAAGAIAGFEKIRGLTLVGITLAAIGVIIIIDPRNASFSSQTTLGDLFIILNSLSYGIYVATSKATIMCNGVFRSMMWVFVFASIICVPLGTWSFFHMDAKAIEPFIWLLMIHIALIATAAPYLLNAWALSKVAPSTVAVFVYLQPLIGFLLAVAFLGEYIDFTFIIAASLVFAGVFLVSKKSGKAGPANLPVT